MNEEMQQMDLREVIADGIKNDKEVGGYLMRYTFLDQTMLHGATEMVVAFQNLADTHNFHFERRAMNDGLAAIPQFDFIWLGELDTFTESLFPMREILLETIGEKAMLSHIVFLPSDFVLEGDEEE
jgi:hypothetical protein